MSLSGIRQRVINGYQHIMACPLVRAWVFLVIGHFIVQVALQGVTLRDNQQGMDMTGLCISLAGVPAGIPLLDNDNLIQCDGIPGHSNVTCTVIASTKNSTLSPILEDAGTNYSTDYGLDQVLNITVFGHEHFITGRCAASLQYMYGAFRHNAAEDIATICFQFWLLIISILAVLQDSIPHLVVCIASHVLDVAWAGFRIRTTIALRQDYYELIVGNACGGEDMLGNWWEQRLGHAVPLFGTNVIALVLLAALAVVLFSRYAKINFCHMGASPSINRMYKIALLFSAFLQLAAFFTILAVGLWIDLLSCSVIAALAGDVQPDQAAFFVLAVVLAPWMISGWWAVFREVKWAFILFTVIHTFLLALWPGMFASPLFRYVLKVWSFFTAVSVTGYLFVVAAAIMAIVCRLNFGKGLAHFLRVESDLSSSGFPATFFTNDPDAKERCDSPPPFDFDIRDTEKLQKGSMGDDPLDIRPFALESTKYSAHSLSFGPSKDAPEVPIMVAFPTARRTSAAIVQALNKGTEKALPAVKPNSNSRPSTADKDRYPIQPLPEACLQDPYKRPMMRTSSLSTQATGMSANSCSQAEVTFARRDQVVSATAKTMAVTSASSSRTSLPFGAAMPHENHPSTNSRAKPKFIPQPDRYGRI